MAETGIFTTSARLTTDLLETHRLAYATGAELTTVRGLNVTTNATDVNDLIGGRHTVVGAVFIGLVAIILMVLTVGGNLLVIIAYRVNRRLRSVNNLFLVSLACSDLVIGMVSMILYPIFIITSNWPFGEVACDIWLCIDYTLSMASVANLMLICLDRYFSVTRPFTYRSKRSRLKAKIAVVLAWIFSLLLWTPAIMIWPRVHERTVDETDCRIQFFENPIITSVTAVLAFYLPVIIMIILYWLIFMETRRCRQYLEYLRSYKIPHSGQTPTVKRNVSAQNSAPPTSDPASDANASPRRRINSTPASSFRAAAPIWRPDPVQENPDESPCESTVQSPRHGDSREEGKETKVLPSHCIAPDSNRPSDGISINNNCAEGKESASGLSRFQRFKQAVLGSLRITFREATNNGCNEKDELKVEHDCLRRGTDSSYCDQSHTLSLSRRSSSGGMSSFPADKSERRALLGSGDAQNQPGPTSEAFSKKHGLVVPIIVTTDESAEARVLSLARRTKSEGDSISSRVSLTVPPTREPAIPASESRAKAAPPGPARIPSNDRKAARTLSAILLAFVVTWLPYNVCVLYSSFCKVQECSAEIPKPVWDFAYYLCYINSTLNPFCYAACNTTFRNTFIRLLTCSRRGSQRRRIRWCWSVRRNRDRQTDTITMQPSTSSSRPPSPLYKKRGSSST